MRLKEVIIWMGMAESGEYGRGLVVSCPLMGVNLPEGVGEGDDDDEEDGLCLDE